MKHLKRILALALLAVSLFAVALPAMAASWDDRYGTGLIQQGDVGTYVRNIQTDINSMRSKDKNLNNTSSPFYFPVLQVDGQFGPATLDAVKKIQEYYHLQVDGVVGPATKNVIWNNR